MADTSRLLELIELIGRKMRRHFHSINQTEGVSWPELLVLRKVQEAGTSRVTELAEEVGVPPSTLTGITDRLVAKGLLTRSPDPADRRAVLLGPGEHLAPLFERFQRARTERLSGIFGALAAEHLDSLVTGLEELLKSLENEDDGNHEQKCQ